MIALAVGKYRIGATSNGIMFIPSFVKISQLVQKLKWGKIQMQHGDHKKMESRLIGTNGL
jgi:hypothetical protein